MNRPYRAPDTEALDRLRRIETRVTKMSIALGVDVRAEPVVFDQETGTARLPSIRCSLKEILDSIPQGWQGPIRVCIGAGRPLVAMSLEPAEANGG